MHAMELPPLSLYVHIPWCVRKCPYCDFNSHEARGPAPEREYVDALLADLAQDAPWVAGRHIQTVFFGGGTPSLFAPDSIARILEGAHALVPIEAGAEITLEANPGTIEHGRFEGYRSSHALSARLLRTLMTDSAAWTVDGMAEGIMSPAWDTGPLAATA